MTSIKRRLILGGALLNVFAAASCAAPKGPTSALLEPYLRIQTALAQDAIDRVPADAKAVSAEAGRLSVSGRRILAASAKLESASDMKLARTHFGELSDAVIEYVRSSKSPTGSDVHLVYCPMVEKSWVQRGTAIRNPYFGRLMLECGEVKAGF